MGFLTKEELDEIGFSHVGENVLVSSKASIYAPEKIWLGDNVRIDDFCILSGRIQIGNYIHIAAYSALYGGSEGIVIDDFANISSRVCIYALTDDYSGETMTNPMVPDWCKNVHKGKVRIGRHVIIGTGSSVMPDCDLAEGCAFGAYSFINRSCAPWGIYVGIPCKRIKERSKELLKYEGELIDEADRECDYSILPA